MKRNNVRKVWTEGHLEQTAKAKNIRLHNTLSFEEYKRFKDLGVIDVDGNFIGGQRTTTFLNDTIIRPCGW